MRRHISRWYSRSDPMPLSIRLGLVTLGVFLSGPAWGGNRASTDDAAHGIPKAQQRPTVGWTSPHRLTA